jgi:hypothetical protein
MPYGKKGGPHMESAKQERKDLMKDMPVDKRASAMQMGHESPAKMGHESPAKMKGSWMSKHSQSAFQMGHESPAKNLGHGMDDMSPEKGAHRKYHLKQRMSKKSEDSVAEMKYPSPAGKHCM